jgi:hypothetical protein
MNFVYSQHALEQIELRGLAKSILDEVLNAPSTIVKQDDVVTVYQKLVIEEDKIYLYRVFVNLVKNPPLVITAYKTSKTNKYEDQI